MIDRFLFVVSIAQSVGHHSSPGADDDDDESVEEEEGTKPDECGGRRRLIQKGEHLAWYSSGLS